MLNTPVVMLVFNRPDETLKVFEAVADARPAKLLVVADGPRNEGEAALCEKTRAIATRVDWRCEVLTNFSEVNLGCRRRVASGLDWVFSLVEDAIILEDDCVPHPDFFPFCSALLDRYRNDERVMMISGDNFLPESTEIEEDYFFSRYFSIWGWATWRRAWRKFDISMAEWPKLRDQGQLDNLHAHAGVRDFIRAILDETHAGKVNSWAVPWLYSCLFNNGLSVAPRRNLVSNIGVEGAHATGRNHNHFVPTFPVNVEAMIHPRMVFPNILYETPYFDSRFPISAPPSRSMLLRLKTVFTSLLNGRV